MHIEYVAKIQLIRICIASTSFTKVLGGQKFGNLPRKIYWANGAKFCHDAMIWIGNSAQKV